MAIYSLSQRTTVTTNAAAAWEMRSTSANKPKLMELAINLAAATASVYGVGRPAAIGITPTNPQLDLYAQPGRYFGVNLTAKW